MKKVVLVIFILFVPLLLRSQTITGVSFEKKAYRLGEKFVVSIKTSGTFAPDNVFIVQISDLFGDFTQPVEVGRINARSDTAIQCQIPDTVPIGKNYQIRIVATNPAFVSYPHPQRLILYIGKIYYVATNGDDNNAGSKDFPFKTIQKAIDVAWYYDTILVQPGKYNENIVFRGIDVALIGVGGPQQTIIDGQKNGNPVVTLENGESSATIIDGFTIQNGVNYQMDNGPGITIKYQNTAPVLRNLIIKDNEAWAFGGGIFCYNAGRVKIVNCKIENNKSKYYGAGIYTDQTNIDIEQCIIRKNSSGGVYCWRSFPNIVNSLIYWNNTNEVTIYSDLGLQLKPRIINSTIVSQNKAYGLYLFGRFIAEIVNSIFYGKDSTIAIEGDRYDTLKIDYTIVYQYPKTFFQDNVALLIGQTFYSDDPLFVNPNAENFALDSCSPALGNALKSISPAVDVYGNPRPTDPETEENPDIGAIESPKQQRSNIVTITRLSKTKFCKGGSFTIDYQTGGCPFFSGNEFIAELSNPNGTFNPSYELGKIKSVNSGTINCTIPSGIPKGSNYKVRIRATNVPYRSEPYSENLAIFDNPSVKIYGPNKVCSAKEYEYWADSSEFPTNRWVIKNGYSMNNLTENKIKVIWFDSTSGSIKLVQTNIAGCTDSAIINVTILPTPPKPSIQQLSDGQLVSSYPSWNQWYWNGQPISGATSRIHKPTKNGYYSVKIIPPTGCESDMSDSIYVSISTVDNGSEGLAITLQGKTIRIQILENVQFNYYFSVLDIFGKEILNRSLETEHNEITLNFDETLAGVYFLMIKMQGKVKIYKLILMND